MCSTVTRLQSTVLKRHVRTCSVQNVLFSEINVCKARNLCCYGVKIFSPSAWFLLVTQREARGGKYFPVFPSAQGNNTTNFQPIKTIVVRYIVYNDAKTFLVDLRFLRTTVEMRTSNVIVWRMPHCLVWSSMATEYCNENLGFACTNFLRSILIFVMRLRVNRVRILFPNNLGGHTKWSALVWDAVSTRLRLVETASQTQADHLVCPPKL